MALEYFLDICTELPAPAIQAKVVDLLGNSLIELRHGKVDTIIASGVTIAVGNQDEFGRKVMKRSYGLEVSVNVYFRLDKFEEYEKGARTAMEVALELMRTTNSDGVLAFIDTPEVLRKNGSLIINSKTAQGNHARELAKEPYVLMPITINRA
jgi:hypothetical protein